MKKTLLGMLLLIGAVMGVNAQALLNEGFEAATFPPTGWDVKQDQTQGVRKHWERTSYPTLSQHYSAFVDAGPIFPSEPAKEEWLITPAITLPQNDKSYKLEYKWKGWIHAALEQKSYDFQVLVSEDDGATWTQLWSWLNKEQVENSGVNYPWTAATNTSTLNVSAYKGKTVKFAFKQKVFVFAGGNAVVLDDVIIDTYTPVELPIVTGSTSYAFEDAYVGVTKYSDYNFPLYIKNDGVGTLTIESISGLDGTDFKTTIDPSKVALGMGKEYAYLIMYTPTIQGARSATMTIKTNGGELKVNLSGTKIAMKSGYTLESFEGNVFPPLGWTNKGFNVTSTNSSSGLNSIGVSLADLATIQSPRLDLSTGSHTVIFDFNEYFETDDSGAQPENDILLDFSKDGGKTWQEAVWHAEVNGGVWVRDTIDLGTPASDNCYLRWRYICDLSAGFDVMTSTFYLDDVVLPPLYGKNMVPVAATNPQPKNLSVNNFKDDLILSWGGVLHATGYKLYVGTDANNPTSVVNGQDMGNKISIELDGLSYNTTYYWKVVPYNTVGDCTTATVWSFSTMADQTVKTFPFSYDFEGEIFPAVGWRIEGNGRAWSRTDIGAYDGKYSGICDMTTNNTYSSLVSPAIQLPADEEMQISFFWGNNVPVGLTKGIEIAKNDTISFEVKVSGNDWVKLAYRSTEEKEGQKWVREKILLEDYKGQEVSFRWRYAAQNTSKSTGCALDNVLIESASQIGKAVFNLVEWNAGVVNNKKMVSSKVPYTIMNDGKAALNITSVQFTNPHFTSSLQAGTVIEPTHKKGFSLQFTALTATNGELKDTMVVSFADGQTAKLAVTATALDEFNRCYTFDDMEAFATTSEKLAPFTLIDVDRQATAVPSMIDFPNVGTPFAYIIMNPVQGNWLSFKPRSGDQVLLATCTESVAATTNDWIITEQATPKENAKFRFFARSISEESYLQQSIISVLISTTGKDIKDFVALPGASNMKVPGAEDKSIYTEYVYDLSSYKDQPVYLAIQHTVPGAKWGVLTIDDLSLENFEFSKGDNTSPVFITEPLKEAAINQLFTYDFTVVDADNDPITISTVGLPSWLTLTEKENGGIISGTPTSLGSVMFVIKASDGTVETRQEVVIEVKDKVGINNTDAQTIRVWPNPATDMINIEGCTGFVTLTDINGKVVYTGVNESQINVQALVPGLYILKVQDNDNVYTTRIIKK